MGPDTSLAQTLISAVRLSGNVGRREGAKCRVGCTRYMPRYSVVRSGKQQYLLLEVQARQGCINHFQQVHQFRGLLLSTRAKHS